MGQNRDWQSGHRNLYQPNLLPAQELVDCSLIWPSDCAWIPDRYCIWMGALFQSICLKLYKSGKKEVYMILFCFSLIIAGAEFQNMLFLYLMSPFYSLLRMMLVLNNEVHGSHIATFYLTLSLQTGIGNLSGKGSFLIYCHYSGFSCLYQWLIKFWSLNWKRQKESI